MRIQQLSILFLLALVMVCPVFSWGQSVEVLLGQLSAYDASLRQQASDQLQLLGPPVLRGLIQQIGGESQTGEKWAKRTVEAIVNQSTRPGSDSERAAVEKELLLILLGNPAPEQTKFTLMMLSRIGSDLSAAPVAIFLNRTSVREMALYALERIPGIAATQALIKAANESSEPAWKAAIIKSLGARHDVAAVDAVLRAMREENYAVRLAAIGAAGRLPDPRCYSALKRVFQTGFGPEKETAAASILVLADLLAQRGFVTNAQEAYQLVCTGTEESHLRCAGYYGLAQTAGKRSWPFLMVAMRDSDPQVRGAARDLLATFPGEEITGAVIRALENTRGAIRLEFLTLMEQRPETVVPAAGPVLSQCLKDSDPRVQKAAAAILARLPGGESSQRLLSDLSQATSEQKVQLIRVLGSRGSQESVQTLLNYARDADASTREAALAALGDIGYAGAAPLLQEALSDNNPRIVNAAAHAVPKIAPALQQQGQIRTAVHLCLQAARSTNDPAIIQRLAGYLKSVEAAGPLADLTRGFGFVTDWWILGPFSGREQLRETDPFPPNQLVHPQRTVTFEGQTHRWKKAVLDDPTGRMNLGAIVGQWNDAGVYLYAAVQVDRDGEAVFHIGSDDDVVCWLNGNEVHRFIGERGWSPDQDTAPVQLKKGINHILLKVLNAGGGWEFSLRITAPGGAPMPLSPA
ncbi:MAG TPA: HEAT repeat domain-containing protein [bacterium]|nr:HEAT repeat domain-containing protein [bacterium]